MVSFPPPPLMELFEALPVILFETLLPVKPTMAEAVPRVTFSISADAARM